MNDYWLFEAARGLARFYKVFIVDIYHKFENISDLFYHCRDFNI